MSEFLFDIRQEVKIRDGSLPGNTVEAQSLIGRLGMVVAQFPSVEGNATPMEFGINEYVVRIDRKDYTLYENWLEDTATK